jgi:hypothetical protein
LVARQLDILALEPYFGGIRRNMLETLVHSSRHRWNVLTLPPRRMERRLAASAHWFAEQIARKDMGPIDLLFTSDALNLADLYRLCPAVSNQPSVVYFHNNQLPDPSHPDLGTRLDLTNLNTATAASEIWFNSKYHARSFLEGVEGLVEIHTELQSRNPMDDLREKLAHVPPPVDLNRFGTLSDQNALRDPSVVFVETRDANLELLNTALEIVHQMRRKMTLLVCGPVDQLSNLFPRQIIPETDSLAQIRALLSAGTFVSTKIATPFDENAVRALQLGCRPVLPHTGIYPELLGERFHSACLYDMSPESLASHIHEALYCLPMHRHDELTMRLKHFDPVQACAVIDDRLDTLVGAHLQTVVTGSRRTKLAAR